MRSPRPPLVAGALAILLAACGGSTPEPPVGADGTAVTLPAPEPGPVPTDLPVSPDAAIGSPLPEIAVRRINGGGGWVQFKNELPSDRAVLVWFWAPH